MVYYGQDYMLEDLSGHLTSSDFQDVNSRIRLSLRCIQATCTHAEYVIIDRTHSDAYNTNDPLAVLNFGPNNSLGTVVIGPGLPMPMTQYLTKVATENGLAHKYHVKFLNFLTSLSISTWKFTAQDGQEYNWSWRIKPEQEWTVSIELGASLRMFLLMDRQCTNANGYHVASYTLKLSGEPDYDGSSGCMLTVEETYPHLISGRPIQLPSISALWAHCLTRNACIPNNYEAYRGT